MTITEARLVDLDLHYDSKGQLRTDTGVEVATCSCGRLWTGSQQAHCTTCHLHFSSDSAFDAHRNAAPRLGPYDEAALCKSVTELREARRLIEKGTRWGPLWARPGSWEGP